MCAPSSALQVILEKGMPMGMQDIWVEAEQ
jgi:hypothetical protein